MRKRVDLKREIKKKKEGNGATMCMINDTGEMIGHGFGVFHEHGNWAVFACC
jgi:hypothetical protein